jgi:lysozyme
MRRLVDVSGYTGLPDWSAVAAAGVEGCYVEAQRGNDGANPLFAQQIAGARGAGLLVGWYHFAYPLPYSPGKHDRDPAGQVGLAWDVASPLAPFDLPPFLDYEWPPSAEWPHWLVTSASIAGWLASALAQLDQRTGRQAGIYAGPGAWVPLGGCGLLDCYGSRSLWLAQYPGARDRWPDVDRLPTPMPPWGRASLWQWGDRLDLGGVTLDGSLADDAGWARLTGG